MPETLDGSKMDRRQFFLRSLVALGAVEISRSPSYSLSLVSVANRELPDQPPVIPLGLDAYRMWDRWAYQRIGARAYMTSTYDRSGGNQGADASHYLYQLSDAFNVTVDLEGPGVLCFARYNHWHGSPWHYQVDGTDYILQDSSTPDPTHPIENSAILPARLFPSPLAITWSTSKGSDLTWVPVPFERSFRMAYERTHYGTGYYIFHRYVGGARLSQPIRSWNLDSEPGKGVLDLIGSSGSDVLAAAKNPNGSQQVFEQKEGEIVLPATGSVPFAELADAPSMIRALDFSVPRENSVDFGRSRLRVTWDGRPDPSIDAPVALFFGAGTLYNRDDREYLVKAFPVHIRFDDRRVHLACYFPMPFFRKARFELVNEAGKEIPGVQWSIRYAPFNDPANHAAYFHATYRDHPEPAIGRDLEMLDTRRVEGGGDWSGSFVGTSMVFSHSARLNTLEGDPRFFFDDSLTPQAQGTGTEEWGGGGDYWEHGQITTLPFAGHPVGAPSPEEAKCKEDLIESEYRFLLADVMPFGKNARIHFEHGGTDNSTEHYETVAYWYGLPSPSLIKTDRLSVGDGASEKAHQYYSPEASGPYQITSRYEWGVDHLDGKEIYPAQTEVGRYTDGTSEFRLKLTPNNLGVMLRRTLDYSFPNQRAEVYVCDASENAKDPAEWKLAGVWRLAGSNTYVYSNPKGELGTTEHVTETSDRRFRDDEFLISRDLTQGLSAIRVRVHFTPVNIPLFPGAPPQKVVWSEIAYSAYCFVMPAFEAPEI
jgi:D-arabinan exo alpha-(1,3)/(1,5)-arabinofuranosidase (non-reducing end)